MPNIVLPPDYRPTKDEEYMSEMQLEYFRQKLMSWKKSLIGQSMDTLDDLKQGGLNQPDQIDRASLESDKALELRTRDRARKLISKIDSLIDSLTEAIEDESTDVAAIKEAVEILSM
jgi:DnaK suppressor protein